MKEWADKGRQTKMEGWSLKMASNNIKIENDLDVSENDNGRMQRAYVRKPRKDEEGNKRMKPSIWPAWLGVGTGVNEIHSLHTHRHPLSSH